MKMWDTSIQGRGSILRAFSAYRDAAISEPALEELDNSAGCSLSLREGQGEGEHALACQWPEGTSIVPKTLCRVTYLMTRQPHILPTTSRREFLTDRDWCAKKRGYSGIPKWRLVSILVAVAYLCTCCSSLDPNNASDRYWNTFQPTWGILQPEHPDQHGNYTH